MYPIGIHLLCSLIMGDLILLALQKITGKYLYNELAVMLTGFTGLLAMFPCGYLYQKDYLRRIYGGLIYSPEKRGNPLEIPFLLVMGAALSQLGNVIAGILQLILQPTAYQETMTSIMEGKSFGFLLLWMGIVAPIAEEMIFRWLIYLRIRDHLGMWMSAILSSLLFGIYHGNVVQAVYATILGIGMAYILEKSGSLLSCVLLHIGANTWSLLLTMYGQVILVKLGVLFLLIYPAFLAICILGFRYFGNKGDQRGYRTV